MASVYAILSNGQQILSLQGSCFAGLNRDHNNILRAFENTFGRKPTEEDDLTFQYSGKGDWGHHPLLTALLGDYTLVENPGDPYRRSCKIPRAFFIPLDYLLTGLRLMHCARNFPEWISQVNGTILELTSDSTPIPFGLNPESIWDTLENSIKVRGDRLCRSDYMFYACDLRNESFARDFKLARLELLEKGIINKPSLPPLIEKQTYVKDIYLLESFYRFHMKEIKALSGYHDDMTRGKVNLSTEESEAVVKGFPEGCYFTINNPLCVPVDATSTVHPEDSDGLDDRAVL